MLALLHTHHPGHNIEEGFTLETVVLELARFLGIAPDEANRRCRTYSPLMMADKWKEANPQTADEVKQFYVNTDLYLYELAGWNESPEYKKRIAPLMNYHGKRILEIGGGIGSACIAMALNGNDVTYFDINQYNTDFAHLRFNERYLSIKQVDKLDGLRDFDIVVAIDTLEHIHKDDLPKMIKDISSMLKDGGFLYCRSNFAQQETFPMHFDNEKLIEELCNKNELWAITRGDFMKGRMTNGVQLGICLATPYIREELVRNLSEIETPVNTPITTSKAAGVDNARNQIVRQLKRDWLFFMDSDQRFPPGVVKRLMSWNVDIISGLVFKRTEEPVPMAYKYCWEEGKGHYYKPMVSEIGEYLEDHEAAWKDKKGPMLLPPTFKGKSILLEVDGIPAGCLLINKRVFDAIGDPWFKTDEGTRAGEDFYFCRKAQEKGFKIYVDPGVICSHYAEEERDIRHFEAWAAKADFPWLDPGAKERGFKGTGPLPPTVYPEQVLRKVA